MACACIKKRDFDIKVSNRGCEYLILEDRSIWASAEGFSKPQTYEVLLKIPSRNFEKVLSINTSKENVFSTVDLFDSQTPQCLPDDIYCFSTKSCGYGLNINRANLCSVKVKLNDLISKYAENMDSNQTVVIQELDYKIRSIEINSERGNLQTAKALLTSVKDTLKNLHCDNC